VKRRSEDLDFLGLVKRWWFTMKSKLTRREDSVKENTEPRNSIVVLRAVEALNSKGWFTTYDV
jgi:hypothetical protein